MPMHGPVYGLLSLERREIYRRLRETQSRERGPWQRAEGGWNERGGKSKNPRRGATFEFRNENREHDAEGCRAA